MDPNRRRLENLRNAFDGGGAFGRLAPPPAPVDLGGFGRLAPPPGRIDVDAAAPGTPPDADEADTRYVTRVLQRLVQRPALNGQVVRVDLRTWDGTTYRVRAGGEVLRVLPGHLRELREDDAAIRVQDQGRAVSQARVDYEQDRLDAGLRYRPPKTK